VTETLASLRGVTKRYATGTLAVEGIDLDIAPGDFLALLGPSGCGKSTLLRMIARLSAATGGRIDWPGGAPSARDIGFVFQEPTLMPWATALANVALPLELAGVPRREAAARAAESLARVELKGFEAAYPRALSGGMKMRVSIARAMVTRPKLLLMDEPFAALDEITRFRLNDDLLASVAATGCTVVFVTHSIYESAYLSTRIAVMGGRPGRVISEISVALPATRDESLRRDPRYLAAAQAASAALREGMAGDVRGAAA